MNFDRLRELILERAIQGKLVPQLESEPKVFQIGDKPENPPFDVPSSWKWIYAKEAQTFVRGITFPASAKRKYKNEGDVRCLTTGSIQKEHQQKSDVFISRDYVKNDEQYLNQGDIIFSSANSRELVGKNLIWSRNDRSFTFGGFLTIARPNKFIILPEYAYYFYQYLFLSKKFTQLASQTTNIANISNKVLCKIVIPVPPLKEQQRIVNKLQSCFAELDRIEIAFTEFHSLGLALQKQVLQKAICGELVPQLESEPCIELPDSQLSDSTIDIPKKWKMVKLKDIFTFIDYRGKTPNKIHEGVRLITASNIKQGRMDHSKKVFISNEEYLTRQSRGISKKGDILFTTEAPLGNVAIADIDNYSAGQRIITLQSKKGNNKLYMYFMLSPYFQKLLVSQATGTTAQGIKAARLKELVIPVPPEGEQERILNKLTALFSFLKIYK